MVFRLSGRMRFRWSVVTRIVGLSIHVSLIRGRGLLGIRFLLRSWRRILRC